MELVFAQNLNWIPSGQAKPWCLANKTGQSWESELLLLESGDFCCEDTINISWEAMVDIPERLESHAEVFIYGVEGEQIEEENDAYNDLRFELGKQKLN